MPSFTTRAGADTCSFTRRATAGAQWMSTNAKGARPAACSTTAPPGRRTTRSAARGIEASELRAAAPVDGHEDEREQGVADRRLEHCRGDQDRVDESADGGAEEDCEDGAAQGDDPRDGARIPRPPGEGRRHLRKGRSVWGSAGHARSVAHRPTMHCADAYRTTHPRGWAVMSHTWPVAVQSRHSWPVSPHASSAAPDTHTPLGRQQW